MCKKPGPRSLFWQNPKWYNIFYRKKTETQDKLNQLTFQEIKKETTT